MKDIIFLPEQELAIKELAQILLKCWRLDIHIAGITDYEIIRSADAGEKPYISLM